MQFDLATIFARLASGDPNISLAERNYMNSLATKWITNQTIPNGEEQIVYNLLMICNAVYNNIPNAEPIISDDLYDRLMVLCKNLNIKVPVGGIPIKFNEELKKTFDSFSEDKRIFRDENGLIEVYRRVPDVNERMFWVPMVTNQTMPMKEDFQYNIDETLVSKKQRAVGHTYDLCGTLDKCKFVLNSDAQASGSMFDGTISIFERDFLGRHVQEGIIDPNYIELVCSLKYDGISIENTVDGDEIVYSLTRGDMNVNEATDMSPIFSGMKFPRAKGIQKGKPFGLKCEYVITEDNLERIKKIFDKEYVNPRNAVIGLTGGLDARKYRDFLTPIPLETSLDLNRVEEIEFMNKYFTKGIDFRYAVVKGSYAEVLYMVRKFVQEAESLRAYMPFIYDGVVVEYINPQIRQRLGKRGSIPRYAIAIKFDPMKRVSTFTHYTYSVGQDGSITPMAHFKPVEFFGATHNKTTAHSYERFKTLGLHVGDKVTLTLVNDVIVYIRRAPEDMQDPNNQNPLVEFPETCPSCGQPLYVSDTEASAFCLNFWCPERSIARLSNCLKKLSLKDFSSETIRALGVIRLVDLYHYPSDKMDGILGNVLGPKFRQALDDLKNANLPDYRLLGSLGFTNLAVKTWKTILEQVPFEEIMSRSDEDLMYLTAIKNIGNVAIKTIIEERPYFMDDLKFIYENFKFTKTPHYDPNKVVYKVRFTGIRDAELANKFNKLGFEADPDAGMTNDVYILIVPAVGFASSKVDKAFKALGKAYGKANNCPPLAVNWQNLHIVNGLTPYVMTVDQANDYCENLLLQQNK